MRVCAINSVTDNDWLIARFKLHPKGTLTLKAQRNSGQVWKNRKSCGEACLAFRVMPDSGIYYENDLDLLLSVIRNIELERVAPGGKLIFAGGITVEPFVNLEPRDLLDNSEEVIRWESDIVVPGLDPPAS